MGERIRGYDVKLTVIGISRIGHKIEQFNRKLLLTKISFFC
jgi:hypothetical protein